MPAPRMSPTIRTISMSGPIARASWGPPAGSLDAFWGATQRSTAAPGLRLAPHTVLATCARAPRAVGRGGGGRGGAGVAASAAAYELHCDLPWGAAAPSSGRLLALGRGARGGGGREGRRARGAAGEAAAGQEERAELGVVELGGLRADLGGGAGGGGAGLGG